MMCVCARLRCIQAGDLVMVGDMDFDYSPTKSTQYVPDHLLEEDERVEVRAPMCTCGAALWCAWGVDTSVFKVQWLGHVCPPW